MTAAFLTGAHINTMPERQRSRSPIPYAWRWAWHTDGEHWWREWFEISRAWIRRRTIADRHCSLSTIHRLLHHASEPDLRKVSAPMPRHCCIIKVPGALHRVINSHHSASPQSGTIFAMQHLKTALAILSQLTLHGIHLTYNVQFAVNT